MNFKLNLSADDAACHFIHWNFFFFCYNSSSSRRSQRSKHCDKNNKHKDNNLHLNSVNNDANPVHSIKNGITRREAYLNVRTVYTNRSANNRKVDGNYQTKEKTNIEKEINRKMSPVRYKNVCISYERKLISSCSFYFFPHRFWWDDRNLDYDEWSLALHGEPARTTRLM